MRTGSLRVSRGFTLIEVMITVVIVAILASIALPAYNGFITRSHIRAAQADLLALSLTLENRYQRTLAYPTLDSSNASTTAQLQAQFSGWSPASEFFSYSATANGTSYTLTATGSGARLSGCSLTIDEANNRATSSCPHTAGDWL